ncbi:carbonic anhydrase 2 [Papiliotrema laurentii]|uniref:Carbonic anhydrase n=1 Tax=Papiliotrema laurentii TaxID=5418 RepID=A0AAD9FQ82_PAPLA|nr:carbonic anhydrase 2 [Papiliotrema laurentii]
MTTSSSSSAAEAFPEINALLEHNKQWAKGVAEKDPKFFPKSTKGQAPEFLWIGCADSRVPESVIMSCNPGEVFVHRNIANQYQLEDDSANSLLDYGVMTVGVKHVMVVGHSACGGCIAAYHAPAPTPAEPPHNALTRFLDPLVKLRHSLPEGSSVDDLIEANVKLSVANLAKSEIMKSAWAQAKAGEKKEVFIHGWVYDLGTGTLRDLGISQGPNGPL